MSDKRYALGEIEASEQLIKELYIELRSKVNFWSNITHQTPQARMGYIGQHLVSVVTGYLGGKSGARGFDIIIPPENHAEIKTCYRVDQLGICKVCKNAVSSLETSCSNPKCASINIDRKDDSKWLISMNERDDFPNILNPKYYYFVLFEFENIADEKNNNIIASIWRVDSKTKGFAYCLIDYFLNIRAKSNSKAPFNMWPHQLKFALTNPMLIYKSRITHDNKIETLVHPKLQNTGLDKIVLSKFRNATTLTVSSLRDSFFDIFKKPIDFSLNTVHLKKYTNAKIKKTYIDIFDENIIKNNTPTNVVTDSVAEHIYLPLIKDKKSDIPNSIRKEFKDLQ